jgi:hypothetical protein
MPFSILDLDDAMLEGKAQIEDIFNEAQQEFYGPVLDTEIAQMWQGIPDEMKLLLKQINPQAVKKVDQKFGGK